MGSTYKFPSGLNNWIEEDKPKREDFVSDNRITDTKFTSIDNKFTTIDSTLNPIPNQVTQILSDISALRNSLTSAETDINTLKSDFSKLEGSVSQVVSSNSTLRNEFDDLKLEFQDLYDRVDDKDSIIQEIQDKLVELEETIENLSTVGDAVPLMNGEAAVGSSLKSSREDHVHPRDSVLSGRIDDTEDDIREIKEIIESGGGGTPGEGGYLSQQKVELTLQVSEWDSNNQIIYNGASSLGFSMTERLLFPVLREETKENIEAYNNAGIIIKRNIDDDTLIISALNEKPSIELDIIIYWLIGSVKEAPDIDLTKLKTIQEYLITLEHDDWTKDADGYTQRVSIPGIGFDTSGVFDVQMSANKAQFEMFNSLALRIETQTDDSVTFRTYTLTDLAYPTDLDIPIVINANKVSWEI